MRRRALLIGLLLAACAGRPLPPKAEGSYQLDYAGVYGTGRIALALQDGKVSGLNSSGAGPSYRGFYRQASDPRQVQLDLIAHLPPTRQIIDGVTVIGTARDVLVRFAFPAGLSAGQRWPVRIETQAGRITGEITRLP
jgi:hypothetical protein